MDTRYHRQTILPAFGPQGQQALAEARVLVIGAGGLGCPVLQYLVAAGVGAITVVDDDVVDMSNLARQVLYDEGDIGKYKVDVVKRKLFQLNSTVEVNTVRERCGKGNVLALMEGHGLVADCSDNFSTRYLVNDAAVIMNLPLVYGAVSRFEGQVAVFNHVRDGERTGNYRDIFPDMPADGEIDNCAIAGVLGMLPGVIGSLMAVEAVKVVSGVGEPLTNQLLTFEALNNNWRVLSYESSPSTRWSRTLFSATDYVLQCAPGEEIDAGSITGTAKELLLVDVRNPEELPVLRQDHLRIPLDTLEEKLSELSGKAVVFVCQSGSRSLRAARLARQKGMEAYSLRGGMLHSTINEQ